MERVIKFRVWDGTKYIKEDDLKVKDFPILYVIGFHGKPIAIDKDSFKNSEIVGWNVDHRLRTEEYTGLKDKNDKEIYEGDIINMWYAPKATCKGIIKYIRGAYYFITKEAYPNEYLLGSLESLGNYIEIIGNIRENKELLQKGGKYE